MAKKISILNCGDCPNHCYASWKGWFNHYCEVNGYSIKEEECGTFPDWCPLEED